MGNQDTANDKTTIRVSGTLDAVATYMAKEFKLTSEDAIKVASLLWLEQECELAESTRSPELNENLKSLEEFNDKNKYAQGMVFNSRFFLNLEKTRADALRTLPKEVVEQLLSTSGLLVKTVKMLFKAVCVVAPNTNFVQEGLACICMRAWNYVKRREHIAFRLENVMPDKELPHDNASRLVCDLTVGNRLQRMGNATWECHCHRENNYCNLTEKKVKDMLDALVDQKILEDLGNGSYAFL